MRKIICRIKKIKRNIRKRYIHYDFMEYYLCNKKKINSKIFIDNGGYYG